MELLRTIIIDDELRARENLKLKLLACELELNIVAEASSVDEGIDRIKSENPDLVFLDIAMPVKNGFDLLAEIDEINFEIIFVTAYDTYAVDAFEHNAVGYVLKPIADEKLIKAVSAAYQRKEESDRYGHLEKLIEHLDQSPQRLTIKSTNGIEFREFDDIIRLESDGNYTIFHSVKARKIISSSTIGSYEELLLRNGFFRTHRAHMINTKYFRTYNKAGFLTLVDGHTVPVAKRKKSDFLKFINNFLELK